MRRGGNVRLLNVGAAFVGATATALVVGGVIADRLGAPADLIATLVFLIVLAAMTTAGLSARTMRPSVYYAAGRATGIVGIAAASLCVMYAMSTPLDAPGLLAPGMLFAACAGAILYGALVAAPLRRVGGLTFADAIAGRFASRSLGLIAGTTAFVLALAFAAAVGPTTITALQKATGLSFGQARLLVAAMTILAILSGGYAGVVAASVTASVVLAAGWIAPAALALLGEAPARAEVLAQAAETFSKVEFSPAGLGLVLSFAGFFAIIGPAPLSENDDAARIGPALAAGSLVVVAFLGLLGATAAGRKAESLVGLTAQTLPAMLYGDAFRGQIRICGVDPTTPDDVQRACSRAGMNGPLPAQAFRIEEVGGGRWLAASLGLPTAAGVAFAIAAPFLLIAALATACHGAAAALNHDLIRRFIIRRSTSSGALALQRILGVATAVTVLFVPLRSLDQDGRIVRLLFFAAAAIPLPLLLLGLSQRVDWRAALCGMASACFAGAGVWYGYLDGGLLFLAGAASSLVAGFLAALLFPARDAGNRSAADVMTGRGVGPLVLDQSA